MQSPAVVCYDDCEARNSPRRDGGSPTMLERVVDAPAHALALNASGTVMARDVEAAIEAAVGPSSAATGLVIVIDPDFDGYLAELGRGLGAAALAHKCLVKLAVVCDVGLLDEAKLSGFDVSPVPIRLFPSTERKAALDWAAAARRGE
jgi:hypothetical protein